MYTMKEACRQVGMSYEALKFYCNQGLVPNVKRDSRNYRIFDQNDIQWIKGLICLKRCGMSLDDMKAYMQLCLKGQETIPERKQILQAQRRQIEEKIAGLEQALDYIDRKQGFYDDVMAGKTEYRSNLSGGGK